MRTTDLVRALTWESPLVALVTLAHKVSPGFFDFSPYLVFLLSHLFTMHSVMCLRVVQNRNRDARGDMSLYITRGAIHTVSPW